MKLFLLALACVIVALLPLKNEGEWQNRQTYQKASGELRTELNRKYFGSAPHYKFIGSSIIVLAIPEHIYAQSQKHGEFHLYKYREFIHWPALAAQFVLLTPVISAYFIVRKKR